MWVRSQDRKRLYKATELFIEKDIYKDWCIETEIGHDYITKDVWYICVNQARLGKYFNEERAIEVLDEIEKLIKPIKIFQNCQVDKPTIEKIKEIGYCMVNDDARVEQISQAFYQMPEK